MLPVAGGLLIALLPLFPEGAVATSRSAPMILDARLRVETVDMAAAGAHLRAGLAALPQPVAQAATAPQSPAPQAPATTPASAAPAAEACDIDCETARENERIARDVLRHRERSLRTHRAFAIAAWSSLLVTQVFGTIQMRNQDTWFGRGACASDPDGFGCRESSLITGLHRGFAYATVGLYVTSGIIAASAADPERASEGDGAAQRRLRLHKTLAWIHGAGMVILPILGLISAYPQMVGASSDEARADVARAMRTLHGIVGYTTFGALTFAGALEL